MHAAWRYLVPRQLVRKDATGAEDLSRACLKRLVSPFRDCDCCA
jgi:hypothetical protein